MTMSRGNPISRRPDEADDVYEIRITFAEAKSALTAGLSPALTMRKLRHARDRKTTWAGTDELQLRYEVDRFLGRVS